MPKPTQPSADAASPLADLVRRALDEDAVGDDVTTRATVPMEAFGRALLVAREACVIAGLDAFEATMKAVEPALSIKRELDDGDAAKRGQTVAIIEGSLRAVLTAERTALNFVQHLSGVATLTRSFVKAANGVDVLDTRKTTPGLRTLEKSAVRAGGGVNHRMDLSSAVLIKDNHIAAAGGIVKAIDGARRLAGDRTIQVECDTLDQVEEAVEAGADRLLLDNMSVAQLKKAVDLVAGRAKTEASGGITLRRIGEVAGAGVDAISVGALTHSARAIDLSLDVVDD